MWSESHKTNPSHIYITQKAVNMQMLNLSEIVNREELTCTTDVEAGNNSLSHLKQVKQL